MPEEKDINKNTSIIHGNFSSLIQLSNSIQIAEKILREIKKKNSFFEWWEITKPELQAVIYANINDDLQSKKESIFEGNSFVDSSLVVNLYSQTESKLYSNLTSKNIEAILNLTFLTFRNILIEGKWTNFFLPDLKPLTYLEKLENIVFCHGVVDSSSFNFSSKNLKFLTLVDCSFADLSFIQNFPNLEYLDIRGINDFRCTNLNLLKDLKKINNLTYIDISGNDIASFEGLSTHTNLKTLKSFGNNIKTVKEIDFLINLEELSIGITENIDLEPIYNLKKIKILDIYSFAVDFEKLSMMSSLESLIIHIQEISTNIFEYVSFLVKLNKLKYLYISCSRSKNKGECYKALEWLRSKLTNCLIEY